MERGVANFAQVVGRNTGGHTHRDALAAVDQQIRKARRQNRGLFFGTVEVVGEVDRVLIDAIDETHGQVRQAALGVAHGGRWIVGRTKVAVWVDQRVA